MSNGLLEVNDLHYTYSDGSVALRGVDFTLHTGEKLGLIGANGSGKSTLLLCLNGLYKATGTVRIDGAEVEPKQFQKLRDRLGLVFQNPDDQLFMPTLADDLAFGPINLGLSSDEVDQRVQQVAERFALTELLDKAPHHLSQGQKHTSAIAAVLAMQPQLLMMDEPTSSLDPRARRRLIDLLGSLDITLLIASHDLAMIAALCTKVIIIDNGKVVAQGNAKTLLADEALMTKHSLEPYQG